jgi:hypothetical protein
LTRYEAAPTNIPLDTMNPQMADIRNARQRHWAEISIKLPLDEVDGADEDTFNRVLWYAARGRDESYPAWAVNETEEEEEEEQDKEKD